MALHPRIRGVPNEPRVVYQLADAGSDSAIKRMQQSSHPVWRSKYLLELFNKLRTDMQKARQSNTLEVVVMACLKYLFLGCADRERHIAG